MKFIKRHWIKILAIVAIGITSTTALNSCTGIPEGIKPVQGFQQKKYLGKWYEIARLDHRFERGMSNVTAEYTARNKGGINVLNRGYKTEKNEWREAKGKAYFVDSPDKAHLKVSFFGPFYGSYIVYQLDKDYQLAYVTGNTRDYLWLLSRTPTVTTAQKQAFIKNVKELGYNTDALIFVDQQKNIK